MIDQVTLWSVIIGLGLGSFGLRFLFLGLVGDRALPEWALRHLRYTAVSILPALVVPLVIWPSATGGQTDPLRLAAGAITLATAYVTKSIYIAMITGGLVMLAGTYWAF